MPESAPPCTAPLPRSQTLPILFETKGAIESAQVKQSLKLDTAQAKEDRGAEEICLSPSWSDHGEKKRKKEKKQRDREKKELDKKAKDLQGRKREVSNNGRQEVEGDKQRAADVKAGKRLSKKPPPAAMETQKMPSGLRRNSLASIFSSRPSSREGSRRNSLSGDDKRLSGLSFSSFTSGRSQSTPATSDESADSSEKYRSKVSATAPRLPSFNWKSRKDSNDMSKLVAWDSEDVYEKEVVEFAYRLDATAFVAESERIEKQRNKTLQQPRKSHFKEHTSVNSINRSVTEPNFAKTQQASTVPKSPPKSPRRPKYQQQESSEQKTGKRGKTRIAMREANSKIDSSTANGYHDHGPLNPDANVRRVKSPEQSAPQELPATQSRPVYDGSSYVHKQRMYQQQMSIAGFEEQQTVQLANELAAKNEKAREAKSEAASTPSKPTPAELAAPAQEHCKNRQDMEIPSIPYSSDGQPEKKRSPHLQNLMPKQPQNPIPVSQCTTMVDVLDHPGLDLGAHAMNGQDLGKSQSTAGSKSDKMLGFRKRTRPPPAENVVSENEKKSTGHQNPAFFPSRKPEESASRRSRMEKMFIDPLAAQIPFRKRTNSAGSANLPILTEKDVKEAEKDVKEAFRTHFRNRTNSSEALTMDLPSPVPRAQPMEIPKPHSGEASEEAQSVLVKQKPVQDKRSHEDTRLGKSHIDSSGGHVETRSDVGPNIPDHPKNMSNSNNKQPSPTEKGENPTQAKELTRYTLVETVEPKITSSKGSPATDVVPRNTPKPILKAPTEAEPYIDSLVSTSKAEPEVAVESINSEGLLRKTSITRPRSNPQLKTQSTATNSLPSLDFLPQLKHQPLVKKTSPPRTISDSIIPRFPAPPPGSVGSLSSSPANSKLLASTKNLPAIKPRSPLRPPGTVTAPTDSHQHPPTTVTPPLFNRSSTSVPSTSTTNLSKDTDLSGITPKPVAKLFIICCKCKFWHDLPSKLYEAMALLKEVHQIKQEDEKPIATNGTTGKEAYGGERTRMKTKEVTQLDTAVKCPWCEHAMTTWCCQGWTTVVYLHQRHH